MIELYTHPMSPCSQKVRIVMAEKGLEWSKHYVDLPNKENLSPEYLKLNPLGVVPTLVHGGQPVIESSIICEYLDDSFPEITLKPANNHARAKMRFWMKHVDNKLHPACGTLQWPLAMRPKIMEKSKEDRDALLNQIPEKPRRERQKRLVEFGLDAPDVADAVRVYQQTIADMETALQERNWIVSNDFSLADACVAPYFQTLYQYGWMDLLQSSPRVADWYARCRARPSYQQAVTADFSQALLSDLQNQGKTAWGKIQAHLK